MIVFNSISGLRGGGNVGNSIGLGGGKVGIVNGGRVGIVNGGRVGIVKGGNVGRGWGG